MATPIIDHNLLTLDYWQDSVTYEGKTVPGGTIGCEALNIPDTLREKLAQASIPLQKIVAAIKENNLTAELLRPAKGSVLHMIQLAKDTPPFSRADAAYYNGRVEHIFSEEGIQNTLAYVQAAAVVGLLATFNEQFRQGVGITKIITLAEEATKSSKCNTLREENFIWGFPAEAFAWTVVDHVRHAAKMLIGQGVKIVALWEEKAQQAVGVLVRAALPGFVWLSEVNRSADGRFQLPELRELRAVVQREAFYGHAFENPLDCLPCFARVAAADN